MTGEGVLRGVDVPPGVARPLREAAQLARALLLPRLHGLRGEARRPAAAGAAAAAAVDGPGAAEVNHDSSDQHPEEQGLEASELARARRTGRGRRHCLRRRLRVRWRAVAVGPAAREGRHVWTPLAAIGAVAGLRFAAMAMPH